VVNIQDLAFLKFPDTTLLTGESKRYYGQVHRAARDAEALIALSESARDDIVQLLGVGADKVAVIPAAAGDEFRPADDVGAAQQWAAQHFGLPAPDEGGYLLFVSTIEPRKNLPVLLEVYRVLIDGGRVAPMPALALAGNKGWLYERIYALIEKLNLTERVRLLGGVTAPELVGLYQGARLFVLPSLYEGFGLPALEALACGVPVITSNAGSLPEVVGEAGVLLDPHDIGGWSDAIERLLLDPQEEARLREAGPKQAANFSWDRAAAQTWELYGRVVSTEY
jgi:glycosyltransferase involved in cell wall biosynthesis